MLLLATSLALGSLSVVLSLTLKVEIETYLQHKGDIHSWVSEGKYDIYA